MNTLRFIAPSGSPASETIIDQLDPPGNTSGSNYVGFFGAGGPEGIPFAVIVGNYQDRTFITNTSGNNLGVAPFGLLGSGELLNHKFASSTSAFIEDDGEVSLVDVPRESGTLLIRFEPSGATPVITQNTVLRAVVLNANSGVNSVTSIPQNLTIYGYEPEAGSSWSQVGGTGAVDNRVIFQDRSGSSLVHDFFVGLSVSPEQVGARSDFGFLFVVEFL